MRSPRDKDATVTVFSLSPHVGIAALIGEGCRVLNIWTGCCDAVFFFPVEFHVDNCSVFSRSRDIRRRLKCCQRCVKAVKVQHPPRILRAGIFAFVSRADPDLFSFLNGTERHRGTSDVTQPICRVWGA